MKSIVDFIEQRSMLSQSENITEQQNFIIKGHTKNQYSSLNDLYVEIDKILIKKNKSLKYYKISTIKNVQEFEAEVNFDEKDLDDIYDEIDNILKKHKIKNIHLDQYESIHDTMCIEVNYVKENDIITIFNIQDDLVNKTIVK